MTSERNMRISTTTNENLTQGAAMHTEGAGRHESAPGFRPEDVGLQPDDPRLSGDYYMDDDDDFRLPDDGGRSLEEIISGAGEREFAQYPPVSMTPEKLKAMADKRKAAERRAAGEDGVSGKDHGPSEKDRSAGAKRSRIGGRKIFGLKAVSIAAMAALVLLGACFAIATLATDVGANKNEKEEIKTEDGVIIEDGGYGASGDVENTWTVNEWEQVYEVKEEYPQIMIPGYIPQGYEFEKLFVEQVETGSVVIEYLYDNNDDSVEIEIFVINEFDISLDINDTYRTVDSMKGTIYIQDDNNNKIATIYTDGGTTIKIWGNLLDQDIIKIVNGLNT